MTRKEYNRRYREKNKEQVAAKAREKYLANKPAILAYQKRRYSENREELLAYQKSYAAIPENREKIRRYIKKYNADNPERHVERVVRWRLENPEKARRNSRSYVLRRRARLNNADGVFNYESWLQKCSYCGWKCLYCKTVLTEETVTVDHRKPLSRGGSNWVANLAPACKSCNCRKIYKTEQEFRIGS